MEHSRPDPDKLLESIQSEDKRLSEGKLRVYIGMAAGVGKTYAMLRAAKQKSREGLDVLVGIVETHGRAETEKKLKGLDVLKRKEIEHRGVVLEEMDIDAVLERKPQIVLVDELAHTNVTGSRHPKRWQDVIEILEAGIDVYTTINIQHVESRKDNIESITDITIYETVPDSILERANHIEVIDIPPSDLLRRLDEGKVYLGDKAQKASENFFKQDKLTALREMLLRFSAEKVDRELELLNILGSKEKVWKTQEKILLAVGHGPSSESLVRVAKQIASNLKSTWFAVYIDTGRELDKASEESLTRNLDLARELGAKVMTIAETDIALGINKLCHQYGITQVVLGKPGFNPLRNLLKGGGLLHRLNRLSTDASIHLVRNAVVRQNFEIANIFIYIKPNKFTPYILVTLFVVVLGLVNRFFLLDGNILPYRSIGMVFLLGVTFVGLLFRLGPTIWASLLAVQIWNFFFIPPLYTFVIATPDDIALAISLFVTATITGALTSTVKKNQTLMREQENRTKSLYRFSEIVVEAQNKEQCLEEVTTSLTEYLKTNVAITLKNSEGVLEHFKKGEDWVFNQPKEWAAAEWCFEKGKVSGRWTDTLPNASSWFVPLVARDEVVGILGVFIGEKSSLNINDREAVMTIASQLALYIQRENLHETTLENEKFKKSEKLHQTLLNSVSHEIKTPLTAITGIVEALEHIKNKDEIGYENLNLSLKESVERLRRIVDNILDVSRLGSETLKLSMDWFSIDDLIENVFDELKDHLISFTIRKNIPEDFPLVYIDGRLFQQVLFNLVLNSIKYSKDQKEISFDAPIVRDDTSWQLIYRDKGPGIDQSHYSKLFDKFFRVPGTETGGSGLGLHIVRSIIELHQGKIEVINDIEEGLGYRIELPLHEQPTLDENNL